MFSKGFPSLRNGSSDNKEDKVQADSQVKKLLALANIPTSKMVTTLKQLMTFYYKIPKT
jgi:hypothetical protein